MPKIASSRSEASEARRARARASPYGCKTLDHAANLNAISSSKSNEDFEPKPKFEGKLIFSSSYSIY